MANFVNYSYMAVLRAKYIPCTNHRGARVKATNGKVSVTLPWDYSKNQWGNMEAAFLALLLKLGIDGMRLSMGFNHGEAFATLADSRSN